MDAGKYSDIECRYIWLMRKIVMLKTNQLSISILNEMHTKEIKTTFETLNVLLQELETKSSLTQEETHVITSIYQFIEKSSILESSLRLLIVKDNSMNLSGNRLTNLYDDATGIGTQKLFE